MEDKIAGELMIRILIAVFIAFIPATIASRKGRSFGLWYFYGLLLFIIALIHSLLIKKETPRIMNERDAHAGSVPREAAAHDSVPAVTQPGRSGRNASFGTLLSLYLGGGVLSIAGYMGAVLGLIRFDWGLFLLIIGVPILLAAIILNYVYMYRMWEIIQDGYARTTPGKAIGFLFIPFFNIYWMFQALWGWAVDYNNYIRRHSLGNAPVPEGLFLAQCILGIASCIPVISLIVILPLLIISFITLYHICKAINEAEPRFG